MTCDHKFVDSSACLKCGAPIEAIHARANISVGTLQATTDAHRALSFERDLEPKGYTNDIIAVMRDTIAAQREAIEAKNALIADLKETLARATRTLAACPSCRSVR